MKTTLIQYISETVMIQCDKGYRGRMYQVLAEHYLLRQIHIIYYVQSTKKIFSGKISYEVLDWRISGEGCEVQRVFICFRQRAH